MNYWLLKHAEKIKIQLRDAWITNLDDFMGSWSDMKTPNGSGRLVQSEQSRCCIGYAWLDESQRRLGINPDVRLTHGLRSSGSLFYVVFHGVVRVALIETRTQVTVAGKQKNLSTQRLGVHPIHSTSIITEEFDDNNKAADLQNRLGGEFLQHRTLP